MTHLHPFAVVTACAQTLGHEGRPCRIRITASRSAAPNGGSSFASIFGVGAEVAVAGAYPVTVPSTTTRRMRPRSASVSR